MRSCGRTLLMDPRVRMTRARAAVSVANRTLVAFAPYHVRHLNCRLTMPAQQSLRGDQGGSPTGSRERSTECREDRSDCWPVPALGREADVREFAPGAGAP